MKKNIASLILLNLLLIFLVACSPLTTPQPTATLPQASPTPEGRTLVLGDISDDPSEVIEGAQPLADYLAEQLQPYGVTQVEIRVARSTDEMTELLRSGEVDIYFDSVYPATLMSDATGASIILRRWRFGVEQYRSVIFASKASGITQLSQLPGQMVAMDAPYSTSGFMLPAVRMTEQGLKLAGKAAYTEAVAAGEVGFVFSYDDENTLQWVLSGFVSAGVTDDYNFDIAFPREVIQDLVVLARTEYTPRQVVVARAGLEETLLQAIKKTLIVMDENAAGQAALEPFQTSQFDEFPEGIDQALQRMRAMMRIVQNIPLPPEK